MSRALTALCVSLLLAGSTAAAATDLGLITGGEGGTYHHIGEDLQRLLKPRGIDLAIHSSRGAVDNIDAVSRRPGVQLAIVQSDLLAFVAEEQSNPALVRIAQGIRLVFRLFDEEVHVVAGHDVTSFEGLAGKRIAIGREGSGTYLTARRLFKLAGIAPAAMLPIEGADALAQLKAGRIDALMAVMAQPAARLRDGLTPDDELALVPITTPAIRAQYEAAEIPRGTYAWQLTPVSTVAVKAALVAYDPNRRHCDAIGRFAHEVVAGMSRLVSHGHPQWKRVDLQRPVKGWESYDCVSNYAGRSTVSSSPAASTGEPRRNPGADAVKDALQTR